MNQQKSGLHIGSVDIAALNFPNKLNMDMQNTSQFQTDVPKYNIEERIKKLPGTKRTNCYKLCLELDIALNTLYKWMSIRKGDKFSIPSDEFYAIAEFLKCTPTDLING